MFLRLYEVCAHRSMEFSPYIYMYVLGYDIIFHEFQK